MPTTAQFAEIVGLLDETAAAVADALETVADWRPKGDRPGQYAIDLVADAAALAVLDAAGVGVLSEESGVRRAEQPIMVVVDPVDGSTNASRRIPWYATSLCALDGDGPLAALVVNQATGERFAATRGGGATVDGSAIAASGRTAPSESVIALSGHAPVHLGWRQYRALGAAALDLCAVAAGRLDGYIDCTAGEHGPWDYLGGLLICHEAGAVVDDLYRRPLVTRGHGDRRAPIAASTLELLAALRAGRAAW